MVNWVSVDDSQCHTHLVADTCDIRNSWCNRVWSLFLSGRQHLAPTRPSDSPPCSQTFLDTLTTCVRKEVFRLVLSYLARRLSLLLNFHPSLNPVSPLPPTKPPPQPLLPPPPDREKSVIPPFSPPSARENGDILGNFNMSIFGFVFTVLRLRYRFIIA